MDYRTLVRDIPDFPKKGIIFKDLTTLWKDKDAFQQMIQDLFAFAKGKGIDKIVGIESRGFILGAPLAYLLNAGFVPARKPGKLPALVVSQSYALEYGTATLEIHQDAIQAGEKVMIIDDLLATGGTTQAVVSLVEKLGGIIAGCLFLAELKFLHGRNKIGHPIHSLIQYE